MSADFYQHAKQVITQFKSELKPQQSELLSQEDEEKLAQLMVAAFSSQVAEIADELDRLCRALRSQVSRPDIGL